MVFARLAFNAEGRDAERQAHLAAHMAHLRSGALAVLQSGPLIDADGKRVGALVVFEADGIAAVEAFTAADPFVRSGVYDNVRILRWDKTIG